VTQLAKKKETTGKPADVENAVN